MSEKHLEKQNNRDFDELLRDALLEDLKEELEEAPKEASGKTGEEDHEFSPEFQMEIRRLIASADTIAGPGKDRAEKQTLAQERMNGKIMSFPRWKGNYRGLVNAASLLLVFGLGIFFIRESGVPMSGSSGASADSAQVTEGSVAAAMAPKAAPEAAPAETAQETEAAETAMDEAAPALEAAPAPAMFRAMPEDAVAQTEAGEQEAAAGQAASEPQAAAAASMANPVVEMDSGEALSEALGIPVAIPEELAEDSTYSLIAGTVGQVRYQSKGLQTEVTYRLAEETGEDISGIYESFDESRTRTLTVGEQDPVELTIRFTSGREPEGGLAVWSVENRSYSLWAEGIEGKEDLFQGEAEKLLQAGL